MEQRKPIKIIHIYKDFNVYNALFGTILTLTKHLNKEEYETQLCVLKHKENIWGLEFEKLGGKIVNLNIGSLNIIRAIKKLVDYLKLEKPDIVQTHELKMNILGRIAARIANVQIIIATIWTLKDTAFSVPRRLRDRLFRPLHRYLDARSDRVIVISEALKKEWDPKNKKPNYQIIYIPFDLERDAIAQNDKSSSRLLNTIKEKGVFIIGLISRLSEEKGIQYLLRAVPEIVRSERNIAVCIGGEGKYKKRLDKIIEKLKIGKYVMFLGHINNIKGFLEKIDLFVQPSRSESLGVAIMEAMANGIPVIASNVGGIPEIVTDKETGLLVKPKNVQELSNKIIYLIRNQKIRTRMSVQAEEVIKNRFGVENYIESTKNLYDSLVYH